MLGRGAEGSAERLLVRLLGRAAVRARDHLPRVGQLALGAEPEHAGRLRAAGSLGLEPTKDELLRSDPDAVAIGELGRALDGLPVQPNAVAAPEVLQRDVIAVDQDSCVAPRHERVLDRHLTILTAADQRDATLQIDFLQMEPEAIARQPCLLSAHQRKAPI